MWGLIAGIIIGLTSTSYLSLVFGIHTLYRSQRMDWNTKNSRSNRPITTFFKNPHRKM